MNDAQKMVLASIIKHTRLKGPTLRVIGKELGMGQSTVRWHILELKSAGLVTYEAGTYGGVLATGDGKKAAK